MHQARAASFSHAGFRKYLCQYCLVGILFSAIAPGYSYNLNIILLQHNRYIHCISIYTHRLFLSLGISGDFNLNDSLLLLLKCLVLSIATTAH